MQALSKYIDKQKQITICLEDLSKVSYEFNIQSTIDKISVYLDSISKDKFNLAVVGNFSRGKSTFIDALMGRKILPVKKQPTTAIISKITYSDKPQFVLYYRDGNSEEISEEEFFNITAPKSMKADDPDDIREKILQREGLDKIDHAVVGYPLEFCRNGVDIVDTPGTNDTDAIRVDITYKYLDRADAVIMVLAAAQAFTKSEMEFLHERILKNQIKDIFFVLNFKDLVQGEECNVINYLRNNLSSILPENLKENLKINLVSSKQALLYRRKENGELLSSKQLREVPEDFSVTGFKEFESELWNFLSGDKGKRRLEGYIRKCREIINEINNVIDARIDISKHSVDDIRKRLAILEPKFVAAKQNANRSIYDMEIRLKSHNSEIINLCRVGSGNIYSEACRVVNEYEGKIVAEIIKNEIDCTVTRCQKQFIDDMIEYQRSIIREEYIKVYREIGKIWNDLEINYNDGFNLPMAISDKGLNIIIESEREITDSQVELGLTSYALSLGSSIIAGAAFPAFVFCAFGAWCFGLFDDSSETIKAKIRQQLSKSIPEISEKIEDNLIMQYDNQVSNLCDSIKKGINSKINDMESQIKNILQIKEQKEIEQQKQLEYLNMKKRYIHTISERLQGMIE